MIQLVREFRIVPVVLIAVSCLFVLKVAGLVLDGGYTFANNAADGRRIGTVAAAPAVVASPPKQSWAQQMLNYPDTTGSVVNTPPRDKTAPFSDITGSVDAKPKEKPADAKPEA